MKNKIFFFSINKVSKKIIHKNKVRIFFSKNQNSLKKELISDLAETNSD